jgi:hypothetical protein
MKFIHARFAFCIAQCLLKKGTNRDERIIRKLISFLDMFYRIVEELR